MTKDNSGISEVRTEYDKDGVKWIYRVHPGQKDLHPQPTSVHYYKATYKCSRCDYVWDSYGCGIPLQQEECRTPWCTNPPLLVVLFRQLKRENISGFGILIKVEIDTFLTGR